MILISARAFGFKLFTWKVTLGIDLPKQHYRQSFGSVQVEVTTGPRHMTAPSHATEMDVAPTENAHEVPDEPAVS